MQNVELEMKQTTKNTFTNFYLDIWRHLTDTVQKQQMCQGHFSARNHKHV